MTLLLIDSFDHYTTEAQGLAGKWLNTNSTPTIGPARNGNGLGIADVDVVVYEIPTPGDAFTVGFAMGNENFNGSNGRYVQFFTGVSAQCGLRGDGAGHFVALRGSTAIATGTTIYPMSTWMYVEVQVVVDDVSGSFILRVDGVEEINFTGDTRSVAGDVDQLIFGVSTGANGNQFNIDDLYLLDDQGGVNDDFLGDVVAECLFPTGNGNSSQLDGSDGNTIDNYLLVDEVTPDGDTTYVESADVGDKDTYGYENLTTTAGTVLGVQPVLYARKNEAGGRSVVTVARLSATETDGPLNILSDTYRYFFDMRETKPGGGTWSITDVNNAEFGMKVNS